MTPSQLRSRDSSRVCAADQRESRRVRAPHQAPVLPHFGWRRGRRSRFGGVRAPQRPRRPGKEVFIAEMCHFPGTLPPAWTIMSTSLGDDETDETPQAVEIVGMEMSTDFPSTFEEKSMIKMVGFDMTKCALLTLHTRTRQVCDHFTITMSLGVQNCYFLKR